jgi:diketogulonate reductase-like aldo/keto reductase
MPIDSSENNCLSIGATGLPDDSEENLEHRYNAWRALIKFQKAGFIRSIGVSNFAIKHLEDLKAKFDVIPAVNQVEWHPKCYDDQLLEYCKNNHILLQAYSSLGTSSSTSLRHDAKVKEVADILGKSPSQVLLRWATQNGVAIIPKATSRKHLEENLNLDFVIPNDHLKILNNIGHERFDLNPNDVI